jgi:hypothetical protein
VYHEVYINKLNYVVVDERAFSLDDGDVEVTKIVCLNADFHHVRLCIYVCTARATKTYFERGDFESAFVVLKFIASDLEPGENFLVFADFGCQNWDFLRSNVMAAALSTGQFDVPSRKRGNEVSAPHGLICSPMLGGRIELTTSYIDTLYSSNELLWSCVYYKDFKIKSMSVVVDDTTHRMSCSINSKSSSDNLMLCKTVPVIGDIDRQYRVDVVKFLPSPQVVHLEELLNYLLSKRRVPMLEVPTLQ